MDEYAELEFIDEPIYIHGFPWRQISDNDIMIDLQKLRKKLLISNNTDSLSYQTSRNGYKCTDRFFQYERLSTRSGFHISCVDLWEKNRNHFLDYWKKQKTKKDLFGTIVFMNRAPSHFSPFVAGMIYKHFKATKVYDPYAGWGDRCLAAIALNIEYIGIDSNPNLTYAYNSMINFFECSNIKFIYGKSEDVVINYHPDLIFSSPPFWNNGKILEHYNDCENDMVKFIEKSISVLFSKYLHQVPIALYINKFMYDILEKNYGKADKLITFSSSCIRKNMNQTRHTIYCWL